MWKDIHLVSETGILIHNLSWELLPEPPRVHWIKVLKYGPNPATFYLFLSFSPTTAKI